MFNQQKNLLFTTMLILIFTTSCVFAYYENQSVYHTKGYLFNKEFAFWGVPINISESKTKPTNQIDPTTEDCFFWGVPLNSSNE